MMITLNIPSELETQVRHAAGKAGVTPDIYITDVLEQHLGHKDNKHVKFSKTETDLLQQINLGLAAETWQHYHDLIKKRQTETLTATEHKTLISITDEVEIDNARRIAPSLS